MEFYDYGVRISTGGWEDLFITVRSAKELTNDEVIVEAKTRLMFDVREIKSNNKSVKFNKKDK